MLPHTKDPPPLYQRTGILHALISTRPETVADAGRMQTQSIDENCVMYNMVHCSVNGLLHVREMFVIFCYFCKPIIACIICHIACALYTVPAGACSNYRF